MLSTRLFSKKRMFAFSMIALASSFTWISSARAQQGASVPLQSLKTFDGQVMRCDNRADIGRMAYRIKSTTGLIKAGQLHVTLDFETLKCAERTGLLAFEKAGLAGRTVNPYGGFLEFSTLEMVGYTPDFKVVKSGSADLNETDHSVTLVAPVSGFVGLLPRNANGNGDRRVVMIAFLRGQASRGDARNGQVKDRSLIAFGAYNIVLSENEGTLTFAR